MTKADLLPAWGRVLSGHRPFLSLEITKECPLRCPGCYACQLEHLPNQVPLRELSDLRGGDLVDGVLALPKLAEMRIEVQLVTSAVRPIPLAWADLPNLHLVVSIDGLQPEHDRRRSPATYARVLEHIAGHQIIVHCTMVGTGRGPKNLVQSFHAARGRPI